jgi:branched-chain amino acid transport system ATP-binding protein
MNHDLLVACNISKRFGGQQVVNDVSFSIPAGSITGLIGPNGAGKTTLFNCLAGFHKPESGKILIDGRNIGGLAPHRVFAAGLARTFQIPRLFPEMTVLDNVTVAARHQAGERLWNNWLKARRVREQAKQHDEAALHWLEFVGLAELARKPAQILSGGQRKLLELARVMIAEPKLVLLDEPGAGVNPVLLERIVEKILALNRQGITFFIVEHNMDLVVSLCHSLMVMVEGQLLLEGDPVSVLQDARVVEAYLGAAVS